MLKDIPVTGQKDTRSGFGDGIVESARKNPNIVALTADLLGSMKLNQFIKEFPERFVQCGIAEANMIGIAAGLTIGGKIPFTTTFANFSTGRVYDQIRQSVAYSGKNVKICASHAGVTLGEDGATHQILEDIGLMKMLPGMTVIVPCDYAQTKAATIAIADYVGPVYLRFGRPVWPIFTDKLPFEIGKAQVFFRRIGCVHICLRAPGMEGHRSRKDPAGKRRFGGSHQSPHHQAPGYRRYPEIRSKDRLCRHCRRAQYYLWPG